MMGMSRGVGDEYQEQMGVVKTEVPTKVHWAKTKCLNDCRFYIFVLQIDTQSLHTKVFSTFRPSVT